MEGIGIARRTALLALCALACAAYAPVRAQSGARLTGLLVDEAGTPLGRVRVSIAETGAGLGSVLTTTRDDGSFSASVVPGQYRVSASVSSIDSKPTDLVDPSDYGVDVATDTTLTLVARRGTLVQTCVVSRDRQPLPNAALTVISRELVVRSRVVADESGWVRFVVGPGESVLVMPPAVAGDSVARWLRSEELSPDVDGIAAPIVLDSLPAPEAVSSDVTRIYRGTAPGRHVVLTFVPEGYTDGDEPFVDRNGNGTCDDEPYFDLNGDGKYELGEPYVDSNGDGKRTSEPFTDLNGDGVCNRGERALFLRNAIDSIRVMLGMPVYRELRDRIDIYAAFVASAQAGSDFVNAGAPVERDTAFGSVFQSRNFIFNIDRSAVATEASLLVPETDVAGVITYSLYGFGRETGNGVVALFGTRIVGLDTVTAHEFGHAIGHLGDEYFDLGDNARYGGSEPTFPNVTTDDGLGALKWSKFVATTTSVPTPDSTPDVVGAFEGAYLHRRGAYRPAFTCLMRDATQFCPVCAETMFARFAEIDEWSRPTSPELLSPTAGTTEDGPFLLAFAVDDFSRIASATPVVDGQPAGLPVTRSPFGITLDASALVPGRHDVAVEVTFVDGSVSRTAATSFVAVAAPRSEPSVGTPRFADGTLVLAGATNLVVPGAVVFVDGADRYPLELTGATLRVPKRAEGSSSGLRFSKAVKRGQSVRLTVVNPDGGRTADVMLVR